MKWWVLTLVLPLTPAILGLIIAFMYVSCFRAVHSAIGQGQLLFVTVGIASRCLIETSKKSDTEDLAGLLYVVIVICAAMYGMATAWKHQAPQREIVASIFIILCSLGILTWVINIALTVLKNT